MNSPSMETLSTEAIVPTTSLFIPAIFTILCGSFAYLLYFLHKRSSERKQNMVMIAGPPRSGKTSLYFKLTGKGWKDSYIASLVPEIGLSKVHVELRRQFRVLELPGHPHFSRYLFEHSKTAAMVIFVLSGPDFLHDLKDTAQKLWQVIDDVTFRTRRVPVLIAVNKSEVIEQCPTERFIMKQLQTEITAIVKQTPVRADLLGDFTFTAVKSEISIAKISVKLDQLSPLFEFINKHL